MALKEDTNQTYGNRFILLGLTNIPYLQALFVFTLMVIYISTLSGNIILLIVVRINKQLQTPMYFFLSNLSIVDICFSSTIVPKLLITTLSSDRSVSEVECALQMYFHLALGGTESMVLTIMSYDRFTAICKPLYYNVIMNKRFCIFLATVCWSGGFVNAIVHVALTFQLPFCRSRNLHHYFCEEPPFFQLSCQDTWPNEVAIYIEAFVIGICSFSLTLYSYVHIICTILKIRSTHRRKVFSTCASHLTAVSLFYGTIFSIYLRPNSTYAIETNKYVSLIYTTVIPMLNPIIYSIRNKDINNTIKRKLK
ncbi:hypothetical protein GDO86_016569 [Hymenochirus boettgeri]|uniref:Olfactory receptor n=1 Tax=Hymenochirus boettgeri TaxID=247094 RepID=A0A8T2K5V5_9PIPI|nr:hypothetical protein GDO86_016569 [Hymenochirus boettgeri]